MYSCQLVEWHAVFFIMRYNYWDIVTTAFVGDALYLHYLLDNIHQNQMSTSSCECLRKYEFFSKVLCIRTWDRSAANTYIHTERPTFFQEQLNRDQDMTNCKFCEFIQKQKCKIKKKHFFIHTEKSEKENCIII